MASDAVISLVRPVAKMLGPYSYEERMVLLLSLVAQEMCNLPPGERDEELRRCIRDLPGILDSTEEGMRIALAMNAREEGK